MPNYGHLLGEILPLASYVICPSSIYMPILVLYIPQERRILSSYDLHETQTKLYLKNGWSVFIKGKFLQYLLSSLLMVVTGSNFI